MVLAITVVQAVAMDGQNLLAAELEAGFERDVVESIFVGAAGKEKVAIAFDVIDPHTLPAECPQVRQNFAHLGRFKAPATYPDVKDIAQQDEEIDALRGQGVELSTKLGTVPTGTSEVAVGNHRDAVWVGERSGEERLHRAQTIVS